MAHDHVPPASDYALYYWPSIPGRGEFVRLVLEQAGAGYDDVARRPKDDGGGVPAMMACLRGEGPGLRPLAPPVLVHGSRRLAQMPNVCAYLAARHGLAPSDEGGRAEALQLQLTLVDLIAETHNTHHPVSTGHRYEHQRDVALTYTRQFVDQRMPKFLRYFESVLRANRSGRGLHLVGDAVSYVDLGMAQVLRGLEYAFARAYAHYGPEVPGLLALREHVDGLPAIAAYRASDRCIPFNEDGIFRAYPELDLQPQADA